MRTTLNDLNPEVRGAMAALLNQRLADCFDLYGRAKDAHWNVRGPRFLTLHELFDRVAEQAEEYLDEIAERCVALGGEARGTVRAAAEFSTLGVAKAGGGEEQYLAGIAGALAEFGAACRKAIDAAGSAGDQGTADLFTEIVRGTDKTLWMVEAHRV